MKEKLQEVDLYKPIQRYFSQEGYDVYGEVHDCDMVAVKGEEVLIIELKLNLSVDLLVQAVKRQQLTDDVYIAIPKPKYNLRSKRWRDVCHLCRRLELGLIVVAFSGNRKTVDVIFPPKSFSRVKSKGHNKRRRKSLIKEIAGRSADYNIGGSNKTKIMTAYKENCIQIACYLEHFGELSPKALRVIGTGDKTSSILAKNFYGWFERVKRGIYTLSDKGKREIQEYPEVLHYYEALLNKMDETNG
ncbi:hypothetical protein EJF36_20870 [Bacillus sp. HMF5848]|uniref:DUF2161 domain-containing phosphodiesterase n=1 Tax=Bacillus sp. HMF5848 TaxID=2495421 RepID=UPI000F79972A|nr:DUF2161 family putative PD-(D/E)XK-type phosphodiesterase [Bacillus sp. HMF5848]RSK29138.1 hypothetical protein EJF36_20870 [Bacillus sp. HMF5848]